MDVYILHLETATKVCSVAISKNGQLIALKESDDSEYLHGEVITLFIEEVLKQAQLPIQLLSAVAITAGPGSYTGLRIGVSTAKGLCFALSIPLISVDALFSLAYLAQQKHPNSTICAMIDARRMEVFSAIYDHQLKVLKPISADILDETAYTQYEPFVVVGDGAPKMQELWKNRTIQFETAVLCSAKGQITKAYEKYNNQEFEDVAYFEPFYLKDFVSTAKK